MIRPGSLGLMLAAQSMQSASVAGIALFLPLIRDDLGLTTTQAGAMGTVATLSYGLSHLPAGLVLSRLPEKWVFTSALMVTNVLTALLFVVDSFGAILALQVLAGPSRALVFASGMSLTATHFSSERQGTAMSVFVMGSMSTNVALGVLGPWLADGLGWRGCFLAIAILGAATLLVYALVSPPAATLGGGKNPPSGGLRRVIGNRVVRACLGLHFTRLGVVTAMAFWLPTILIEAKGMSYAAAGASVAAATLLAVPGNLIGGYLADRTGRPAAVIAAASAITLASTIGLSLSGSAATAVACALVTALAGQAGFGPLFSISAGAVGPDLKVLSNAVGALCAVMGGAVATFAMGLVAGLDDTFTIGIRVVSVIALLGLLLSLQLARTLRTPLGPDPLPVPDLEARTP